jgi:hypothetical protein
MSGVRVLILVDIRFVAICGVVIGVIGLFGGSGIDRVRRSGEGDVLESEDIKLDGVLSDVVLSGV